MLDLIPRKPFSELSTVRSEMDRLWNRFLDDWPLPAVFAKGWAPMADISETKDKLIVKAELPGLEPEDKIDAKFDKGVLTITMPKISKGK